MGTHIMIYDITNPPDVTRNMMSGRGGHPIIQKLRHLTGETGLVWIHIGQLSDKTQNTNQEVQGLRSYQS